MEDEKEDCSWALALDDSERIAIATKLASDLWSAAHEGAPFPTMNRSIYNYIAKVEF
jgi:transcriptional/translational regulatory protein YebC/TACO1